MEFVSKEHSANEIPVVGGNGGIIETFKVGMVHIDGRSNPLSTRNPTAKMMKHTLYFFAHCFHANTTCLVAIVGLQGTRHRIHFPRIGLELSLQEKFCEKKSLIVGPRSIGQVASCHSCS